MYFFCKLKCQELLMKYIEIIVIFWFKVQLYFLSLKWSKIVVSESQVFACVFLSITWTFSRLATMCWSTCWENLPYTLIFAKKKFKVTSKSYVYWSKSTKHYKLWIKLVNYQKAGVFFGCQNSCFLHFLLAGFVNMQILWTFWTLAIIQMILLANLHKTARIIYNSKFYERYNLKVFSLKTCH